MYRDEDDPLCQTTPFSVATLRDLVARSTDDRSRVAPEPTASPTVSKHVAGPAPRAMEAPPPIDILAKGAPVLVFPEPPPPPPPPARVPRPVAPLPSVMVETTPVRRVRAQRPKRGVAVVRGGFFQRRLLALALLALAVASQPWWWNLGDVRPHRPGAARVAQPAR